MPLPSQLRLLWRRAAANPGLTLLSLLTLAVAVGANVAIFTVVNAVLLRPLPFPDSERLILLTHAAPQLGPLNDLPMSDALHFLYADQSRTLDGVVGFSDVAVSFTGPDNPQSVPAASVTASFFDVLRTPPRLGRPFTHEDDRPGAAPVVVIGDGLWRSRFGAGPGIVGRVVEIDRESVEIVGVMPPGFAFPRQETELWRPMGLDPENVRLGFFGLNGVARMADGSTLEQVRAELGAMLSNLEELLPDQPAAPVMAREYRPQIVPVRAWVVGDIGATLWILFGAVGFLLLVGSGLAVRSFQRLAAVDPGFDPVDVLTFALALPPRDYDTPDSRLSFYRQVVERLHVLLGAVGAASSSTLPLDGVLNSGSHRIEGRPLAEGEVSPMFAVRVVSPGYFDALRIGLVEGRVFDRLDEERDASVVIVSRSLARARWPGESALGKGVRMGAPPGAEGEAWSRIVGVVDDVHETALHEEPPEMAYYPVTGDTFVADVPWPMRYMVRAPNAAALAGPVREAVRGLDPALPVIGVETLETRVGRARGTQAFVMVLLAVAAGFALLLGAVGLYGIVSYTVAQRRREIAIRMAVGAQPGDVRRLVLAEAGGLAVVGVTLAVGAALGLTGQLRAILFETSPLDPTVFVGVSVLLASVCLAASWVPASRAVRVEPVTALRAE